MSAIMQINQVGLAAGVPGLAREDGLATGALVTVISTAHEVDFEVNLLWVGQHPQPDTTSVQTLQPSGTDAVTFTPTPSVYGSWRIELITDRGTPAEDRQVRIFAIKPSAGAVRIPAGNEASDPEASLEARSERYIEASEFNAGDGVLGSPQRDRSFISHWKPVADTIHKVNTLTGGEGGGEGDPSDAMPVGVDAGAGSPGAASDVSRSDHRHSVQVGAPVDVGTANAPGVSTALARADHVHKGVQVAGTTPTSSSAAAGATGTSADAARADHRHQVSVGSPVAIGASSQAGTADTLARSDHVHAHGDQAGGSTHPAVTGSVAGFMTPALLAEHQAMVAAPPPAAGGAPVDVTKAAAAAGVATTYARSDHKHDIQTAAPVAVGNAGNSEGTATTLARSDHVHNMPMAGSGLASLYPILDTGATYGTSGNAARADHSHNHGSLPGGSNHALAVAGGANGFISGADQLKLNNVAANAAALTSAAPADVTKAAASVGVATLAARADHKHDVSTAAPVNVGSTNAEGSASTLARSDHIHALVHPTAAAPNGYDIVSSGAQLGSVSGQAARVDHTHNHGSLAGGTLHAVCTTSTPGFASAADKVKIDGSVQGPASSTLTAVPRFSTSDGKAVVNSGVIIDAGNNMSGVVSFSCTGNITMAGGATVDGVDVSTLPGLIDAKASRGFESINSFTAPSINVVATHNNALLFAEGTGEQWALIPTDATLNLPVGFTVTLGRGLTPSVVGFSWTGGTTTVIYDSTSYEPECRTIGSGISAVKLGPNKWWVTGDLNGAGEA